MTEQEWLACTDPTPMLDFLKGKANDRKLRLFSVACCRTIWRRLADSSHDLRIGNRPLLLDHEKRIIHLAAPFLEVADQYADGKIEWEKTLTAYCELLHLLFMRRPLHEPWAFALVAALRATSTGRGFYGQDWEYETYDAIRCASDVADYIANVAGWIEKSTAAIDAMQEAETIFLRCIFGNPFRPIAIDPRWLTSTVVDLATAIYDERAFDRMPILADALMDAGCDNEEIIAHCRSDGVHTRGCWAVDLILGKE
jgi:hypothetical protein